jgi:hypothetical protein
MLKSLENPYYFTLLLVVIILMLVIYSYENILDNYFSNHIKFFIYTYFTLLTLLLVYNDYFENEILKKHGLNKDLDIVNEIYKKNDS